MRTVGGLAAVEARGVEPGEGEDVPRLRCRPEAGFVVCTRRSMGGRRKIAPGHVGTIAAHYLVDEGCWTLRRGEGGYVWTCPGCGGETYEVDLKSGKAGCVSGGCAVPRAESWVGVVAHFTGLDRKDDWDEIRRIGLEIVEEREQASARREAQEKQAQEAEREAEARRRAQEAEDRKRGGESPAEGKPEQRATKRDERDQHSLAARRLEEERLHHQKAEKEAREALRRARASWKDQHRSVGDRAVAALAPVLRSEILLGSLAGGAAFVVAYHGVGWVASWSGPDADPAVLGAATEGGDGAGWFGPLTDRAAAAAAHLVPSRLPGGLLLMVSTVYLVASVLSRRRRARYAFDEDEYLAFCRPDERGGDRLVRVHLRTDLSEVWKEPLRRFARGAARWSEAFGEALIWGFGALRMLEASWSRLATSALSGLSVGGLGYLSGLATTAAVVAAVAVVTFLVVLALTGDQR